MGSGATFPPRASEAPFHLRLGMGTARAGPGTNLTPVDGSLIKLDRLVRLEGITDSSGVPTIRFQTIWQRQCEAIERAFGNQQGQITDLTAIIERLQSVEELASVAVDTAQQVQLSTDTAGSWVEPSRVMSKAVGAPIDVFSHTRVMPDGQRISVNGAMVSVNQAWSGAYVYYDDPAKAGGNVTYIASETAVAQLGGRFNVGYIRFPTAGQPPSLGNGPSPPGNTVWPEDFREDIVGY